jgi:uncharacterized membrane protein HdeD (DUF308 family)
MTSAHSHPAAGFAAPRLLRGLARNWWKFLLRGVVAIGFGVLAFAWPGATILALAAVWGAYALIDGVIALWAAISGGGSGPRWWLAIVGLIGVAAGAATFASPGMTALVLLMFVAAWAFLGGIMQIIGAFRLRKEIQGEWLLFLSGLLSMGLGAMMFAQPAAGAVAAVWLLGAFAIVIGVVYIALALRLKRHKPAD